LRQINYSSRDAVHVILSRVLPLLALLSAIILKKNFWLLLPVYFLLAYFNLLHALTHAEVRLSEPLLPLLLVLIAGAAVAVFQMEPGFQNKLIELFSPRWQKNV
jgi:hypothetical protein